MGRLKSIVVGVCATIGLVLAAVAAIFFSRKSGESQQFPQKEKKKAEAELKELKKEEEVIEKKEYSNEELEKIFKDG